MVKKSSRQTETPEIDPEKWSKFEATLKRALDMPHRPHKPSREGDAPTKKASRKK
jgi:hypothetical protein